jgi:hypothetical protein
MASCVEANSELPNFPMIKSRNAVRLFQGVLFRPVAVSNGAELSVKVALTIGQHYTAFRSTAKPLSSTDTSIHSQGSATMRTRLIGKPSQRVMNRLVEPYGEQPVCVRYRDDE